MKARDGRLAAVGTTVSGMQDAQPEPVILSVYRDCRVWGRALVVRWAKQSPRKSDAVFSNMNGPLCHQRPSFPAVVEAFQNPIAAVPLERGRQPAAARPA